MNAPLNWIADLQRALARECCVLVTLRIVSGSAPRESGSRMVVTADAVRGSIGGGNLEFEATAKARRLLDAGAEARQEIGLYGLGPALNQCCGGAVALHYEVIPSGLPGWLEALVACRNDARDTVLASRVSGRPERRVIEPSDPLAGKCADSSGIIEVLDGGDTWWVEYIRDSRRAVWLFGAGHVGREVARTLAPLPFDLNWVDSRENAFHGAAPDGVRVMESRDPAAEASRAPPGAVFVVMTHSHALDEDICLEILKRGDFAFLGLIGSDTKRRRFVHRLEQRGADPALLERLVCPIGLAGIRGKQPATIALSLAAQLMTPGFARGGETEGD